MLCRASVVGAVHRCGGAAARQFALTGRLIQAQFKFALTSHALLACGCATGCERRSPCTPCSLCKIKSEAVLRSPVSPGSRNGCHVWRVGCCFTALNTTE